MPDHFTTLQSKGLTIYQRDDLPEGLTANAKLFADDTLLFLVAHDPTGSSVSLKNDLTNNFSMGLPVENDIQPRYLKKDPRGCFVLAKQLQFTMQLFTLILLQ